MAIIKLLCHVRQREWKILAFITQNNVYPLNVPQNGARKSLQSSLSSLAFQTARQTPNSFRLPFTGLLLFCRSLEKDSCALAHAIAI